MVEAGHERLHWELRGRDGEAEGAPADDTTRALGSPLRARGTVVPTPVLLLGGRDRSGPLARSESSVGSGAAARPSRASAWPTPNDPAVCFPDGARAPVTASAGERPAQQGWL